MFFPKLRRKAKWVFLALALVFGLGFVVFGVGTGVSGTSIGDILNDVFRSGGSDQPSVEDARDRLAADPNDAGAQLELANALQAAGETEEAIAALLRYGELRPQDIDAKLQLAGLYDRQVSEARNRVAAIQAQAAGAAPGQLFGLPTDSELGLALSQDPIEQAITAGSNARVDAAVADFRAAAARSQLVYEELTLLDPNEPSYFLRLGQASEFAGDIDAAIAAYEQFLELSPDDSSAPLVEQQLEILRGETAAGEAEPASTSSAG
jgi:tetratricopeptide (TPR) repeat protein